MRILTVLLIILILTGCKNDATAPEETEWRLPEYMEIGADHLRPQTVSIWADIIIAGDSLNTVISYEDPGKEVFFDCGDKYNHPKVAFIWAKHIHLKNPDTRIFYWRKP